MKTNEHFIGRPNILSAIKKGCPKYSGDLLYIEVKKGGTFPFVIIQNNKLFRGFFSTDKDVLDIGRLNEYFETGKWDSRFFYQLNIRKFKDTHYQYDDQLVPDIFVTENEEVARLHAEKFKTTLYEPSKMAVWPEQTIRPASNIKLFEIKKEDL